MDKEELRNVFEELSEAYESFKREVKSASPRLYERWKAGGFLIDPDIVSMYPNAHEVFETLDDEVEEDEEEFVEG